jgi:hypothetical protein
MSLLRNPTITLTAILACLFLGSACGSDGGDETSTTSDTSSSTTTDAEETTTTSGTDDAAEEGPADDAALVDDDDAAMVDDVAADDDDVAADDDDVAADDDDVAADDDDVAVAPPTCDTETSDCLCWNPDDMAVAQDCDVDLPGIAQTIGISCLFDADPAACALPQMVDEGGITEGCAGCYIEQVTCAAEFCLSEGCMPAGDCLTDAEGCAACRAEKCTPLWEVCSGFPPADPEAPDPCASDDDPPDPCD